MQRIAEGEEHPTYIGSSPICNVNFGCERRGLRLWGEGEVRRCHDELEVHAATRCSLRAAQNEEVFGSQRQSSCAILTTRYAEATEMATPAFALGRRALKLLFDAVCVEGATAHECINGQDAQEKATS